MHVHKFKFEKTIMNQLNNKYCFDMWIANQIKKNM